MTAARKRAEAMARAAMPTLDARSEHFRESVIQGCMEEAAMLDTYFAHTWFVEEQELRAGFKKRPVRLYPKPETIE